MGIDSGDLYMLGLNVSHLYGLLKKNQLLLHQKVGTE